MSVKIDKVASDLFEKVPSRKATEDFRVDKFTKVDDLEYWEVVFMDKLSRRERRKLAVPGKLSVDSYNKDGRELGIIKYEGKYFQHAFSSAITGDKIGGTEILDVQFAQIVNAGFKKGEFAFCFKYTLKG